MLQQVLSAQTAAYNRGLLKKPAKGEVVCRPGKCGMGKPTRGKLLRICTESAIVSLVDPLETPEEIEVELLGLFVGRVVVHGRIVDSEYMVDSDRWELHIRFSSRLNYRQLLLFVNW